MRPIHISFDGLARVDGSARFSFGDTTALASVSGPIEVRLAAESASQATFEVLLRPLSNVSATDSKALASTIRAALTPSLILSQNPRTLIQLVVQSLSAIKGAGAWRDGLVAAMINASTLALLNAGSVPMRGIVCAIAVGRRSPHASPGLLVDPAEDEAASLDGGGCFAFLFADGFGSGGAECAWTSWKSRSGAFNEGELVAARELARAAAKDVWSEMKASVGRMGAAPPFVFSEGAVFEQEKKARADGDTIVSDADDDKDKMEI